jgi:hypothetical protein
MKKLISALLVSCLVIFSSSIMVSADFEKNENGTMYITETGEKATGFKQIDKSWYYFDKDGYMVENKYVKINGYTYFFSAGGKMFTGWTKNSSGKYTYYKSDGKRATGWTVISSKYYYFGKSDGIMLTGSYKIDGNVYTFSTAGVWTGTVNGVKSTSPLTSSPKTAHITPKWGASVEDIKKAFTEKNIEYTVMEQDDLTVIMPLISDIYKYDVAFAVADFYLCYKNDGYVMSMSMPYSTVTATDDSPSTIKISEIDIKNCFNYTSKELKIFSDTLVEKYDYLYGEHEQINSDSYSWLEVDDNTYRMVLSSNSIVLIEKIDLSYMLNNSDEIGEIASTFGNLSAVLLSNSVSGKPVSDSTPANDTSSKPDNTIVINENSTPKPTNSATRGETNALSRAKEYLAVMPFSHKGLIEQLKYEGFSSSEAKYGADHCGANWNKQAILKARAYLEIMSFSRQGLIEQLEYDGFTHAQAVYGVDNV